MGLAPYGEPRYADLILEQLVDLKEDGSFRLDMAYFNYCQGLTMTNARSSTRSSAGRRAQPGVAARRSARWTSPRRIQEVTEEIMLRMARHVHRADRHEEPVPRRRRGAELRRQRPHPARGAVREHLDPARGRRRRRRARRGAVRLAPAARTSRAGRRRHDSQQRLAARARASRTTRSSAFLDDARRRLPALRRRGRSCCDRVAGLLAAGEGRRLVRRAAWSSARGRSAPAASSATRASPQMQSRHEPEDQVPRVLPAVRPVGAARSDVARLLRDAAGEESPYMLLVAPVRRRRSVPPTDGQTAARRASTSSSVVRSDVPAITHVDYSARVQTVDAERHGRATTGSSRRFERQTGCPVIINTSFNVRGEPIVCTPRGRLPLLHGHRHGRAGARGLRPAQGRTAGGPAPRSTPYLAQFELD